LDVTDKYDFIALLFLPIFLIMIVVLIMSGRREKDDACYILATVSFIGALISVFAFLKQYLFALPLGLLAGLLFVVGWPKLSKLRERRYTKYLEGIDFSAPFRVRDFITLKAWPKMATQWGVWKTTLLYWLFLVAFGGGILFIASLLGIISMTRILIYAIPASILPTYLFYRQISKSPSLLKGDLNEK
jgi:hypothetical protein